MRRRSGGRVFQPKPKPGKLLFCWEVPVLLLNIAVMDACAELGTAFTIEQESGMSKGQNSL